VSIYQNTQWRHFCGKKYQSAKIKRYLMPRRKMAMNKAYLLIGGNMGDRTGFLEAAKKAISSECGPLTGVSSLYQTAAWGLEEQPPFLNQVLEVGTALTADTLLEKILAIEKRLGRHRQLKYGPRIIDIDILLFGNEVIEKETLTVPHPQLQNRRFALTPLAELASDFVHPVFNKTIQRLLLECIDTLPVQKISGPVD
jgi:2-amino-4-hydroxy-6-hydroxymethyldihydropteridine diphosphokinase